MDSTFRESTYNIIAGEKKTTNTSCADYTIEPSVQPRPIIDKTYFPDSETHVGSQPHIPNNFNAQQLLSTIPWEDAINQIPRESSWQDIIGEMIEEAKENLPELSKNVKTISTTVIAVCKMIHHIGGLFK